MNPAAATGRWRRRVCRCRWGAAPGFGADAKAFICAICVICGQKNRRPITNVQQGNSTADVADDADGDPEGWRARGKGIHLSHLCHLWKKTGGQPLVWCKKIQPQMSQMTQMEIKWERGAAAKAFICPSAWLRTSFICDHPWTIRGLGSRSR
jgi:hypothetical protein